MFTHQSLMQTGKCGKREKCAECESTYAYEKWVGYWD